MSASVKIIVMKPKTAPMISLTARIATAAMTIHARTRLPRFPSAEFCMVLRIVLLAAKRPVRISVVAAPAVLEALGARDIAALEPQAGKAVVAHAGVAAAG